MRRLSTDTAGELGKNEIGRFFDQTCARSTKIANNRALYVQAFKDALKPANVYSLYGGTQAQNRDLWAYSSVLIGRYLDAIELVDPQSSKGGRCVEIKEFARNQTAILKELTWTYVILHHDLATIQYGQRLVIHSLFDIFHDAIVQGRLELFPVGFAQLIQESPGVPPARWTADYLSGLTEQEVGRLHHRLANV